ncbi:MAG: hypothetical protein ACRYFU_20320 [Janthinobacterium lividum]
MSSLRPLLATLAAVIAAPLMAQAPARPSSASRPVPALLHPYVSCKLPLGPDLVQHTALPQAPMTRTAQTLTGPKPIKLVDGVFAAFGYPDAGPFANVKIEQLPAATYSTEKSDVISEFDAINAKGEDTQRNYALKPMLNGFEIYGFDRTALDGNVLGIYLFFDNAHHVATTAYFLNAPEALRKFHTVAEYSQLREAFLNAYTVCVRKQLAGGAPAASAKPAARATSRRNR